MHLEKVLKFTKQDRNHETIMLMKMIVILLNKYPTKNCITLHFT